MKKVILLMLSVVLLSSASADKIAQKQCTDATYNCATKQSCKTCGTPLGNGQIYTWTECTSVPNGPSCGGGPS